MDFTQPPSHLRPSPPEVSTAEDPAQEEKKESDQQIEELQKKIGDLFGLVGIYRAEIEMLRSHVNGLENKLIYQLYQAKQSILAQSTSLIAAEVGKIKYNLRNLPPPPILYSSPAIRPVYVTAPHGVSPHLSL